MQDTVWQYIVDTGRIIGSVEFPTSIPQESVSLIQDFVAHTDPNKCILFVYYDSQYNLRIENALQHQAGSLALRTTSPQVVVQPTTNNADSPDLEVSDDSKKAPPPPVVEEAQNLKPDEATIFYFLNNGHESQDPHQFISFGAITPQIIDQLLNVMTSVFVPWIRSCQSWPTSVKDEFLNQLERYMSSVTEVSHLQRGRTVLYIPLFEDVNPQESSRNKDIIPRLETLVVSWTRQIKELISGVHSASQDEAAHGSELLKEEGFASFALLQNPLSEIDYWRRRNDDLQQVIQQLKSSSLVNIVQTLKYAQSHYALQFESLEKELQEKTNEAQTNLEDLSIIEDACIALTKTDEPKEIIKILPQVFEQIRAISSKSKYYRVPTNLSSLLRRLANAVVNACARYISLQDVFNRDSLFSIEKLISCKDLIKFFRDTYKEICSSGDWEDDNSVIASCDAFSQRCIDLCEICQDRLQFARPRTLIACRDGLRIRLEQKDSTQLTTQDAQNQLAQLKEITENIAKFVGDPEDRREGKQDEYEEGDYMLPKFLGSQGQIIRKSLKEMEDNYMKTISKLIKVKYNHLDVHASQWHEDIARYRQEVKDFTIFAENIMRTSFTQVQSSIVDSCNVLESFEHLASRPSFKSSVQKRISETIRAFIDKVNHLKTQFETLKASATSIQQSDQSVIVLNQVLAHFCFMPNKGAMALNIKRLMHQLERDWGEIVYWLNPKAKQLAQDAYVKHKQQQQIPFTDAIPKDEYEAVDVYVRTKVIFETNIDRTFKEWRDKTIKDNPKAYLANEVIVKEPNNRFSEQVKSHKAEMSKKNRDNNGENDLNITLLESRLKINFPEQVDDATKEHMFWSQLNYESPPDIKELYNKRNKLHLNKEIVGQCVMDVNNVLDSLHPEDVTLFKSRLSKLANCIEPLFQNKGWESDKLTSYINKVRREAVENYQKINMYYQKKQVIETSIKNLLSIQIIQIRKDKGAKQSNQPINLQDFIDFQVQVRANAIFQIQKIFEDIQEALITCYDIFRQDGENVKNEWIKHVLDVDTQLEENLMEMYVKQISEFSVAITGRRSKPENRKTFVSSSEPIFSIQIVLETNKGPELRPSTFQLKQAICQSLKQTIADVVPRLPRLSQSLIEKETKLREEMIKLKEQQAKALILQKENEGLQLSDQDKAEIWKEVDEWKNTRVPEYIIRGNYIDMFSFLDKYWKGEFDVDRGQESDYKQIENVIMWLLVYFELCGQQCTNIVKKYQTYQDVWLENPNTYYQNHSQEFQNLKLFKDKIQQFQGIVDKVQLEESHIIAQIIFLDAIQLIKELHQRAQTFKNNLQDALLQSTIQQLNAHEARLSEIIETMQRPYDNIDQLKEQIIRLDEAKKYIETVEQIRVPIEEKFKLLFEFEAEVPPEKAKLFEKLKDHVETQALNAINFAQIQLNKEKAKYKEQIAADSSMIQKEAKQLKELIEAEAPFQNNVVSKDADAMEEQDIQQAKRKLRQFNDDMERLIAKKEKIEHDLAGFSDQLIQTKEIFQIKGILDTLKDIWAFAEEWTDFMKKSGSSQLKSLNQEEIVEFTHKKEVALRKFIMNSNPYVDVKSLPIIKYLQRRIEEFKPIPNLIVDLQNQAMRSRHWGQITEQTQIHIEIPNAIDPEQMDRMILDPNSKHFTLLFIIKQQMHVHSEIINQISGGATQEEQIEQNVAKIEETWNTIEFTASPFASKGIGGQSLSSSQHYILKQVEDIFTALEESTLQISALKGSKFAKAFEYKLDCWENMLAQVQESIELMLQAQRSWMYLESIFSASEDIRKQLPAEALNFDDANENWRRNMTNIYRTKRLLQCLDVTEVNSPKIQLKKTSNVIKAMLQIIKTLDGVQKSLEDYLELKRSQFPRFYFLSNDELLEILAQARNPLAVQPHIKKCFDGIKELEMENKGGSIIATALHGLCSEYVPFKTQVNCSQAVEVWLNAIEQVMRATLKDMVGRCYQNFVEDKLQLPILLGKWPGQLCVVAQQLKWTTQVGAALASGKTIKASDEVNQEKDPEKAAKQAAAESLDVVRKNLKNARKRSVMFLQKLTDIFSSYADLYKQLLDRNLINSNQQKNYSPKLIGNKTRAQITLEIHNRDIIDELYHAKVQSDSCFEWFSQLKYYILAEGAKGQQTDYSKVLVQIRQTDTVLDYQYEYCNNSGRLVITPLTDRCYITITSSIQIKKGTLPQGPAGTGKTETVKDLSKGIAVLCVVFNCSDGLDYKSLGRMFSGLCQCGAWSCFDEFNRLLPDVLSVVAQQVNSILAAISRKLYRFQFEGREIPLNHNCNICITMNPGYAGRSELPENLQQLFRPISMVVPDMRLIAEVMIQSEGFKEAKVLGQKLTSLFALCNLQLSKQSHYDWTLRSLKAILVAAGSLKRQDPDQKEDQILMRAMSFSTEPKLIKADLPLFRGLVSDLFPGLELSEVRYGLLEAAIDSEFLVRNLQFNPKQKEKILQLYEAKLARHGVMLIGRSGGSKTTAYEILCSAMIRCFRAMIESCDPAKGYKNPYVALIKSLVDSKELTNLNKLLKDIYHDSGQDATQAKNHFVKCIYFVKEQIREKAEPGFKSQLTEPIYDTKVITVHDKQFGVIIKFMNPKSLTLNQLYGAIDENTMEWVDGIVSNILRQSSKDSQNCLLFGNYTQEKYKEFLAAQPANSVKSESLKELTHLHNFWITYDGPVDTLWIESQNSVLDDSKVLTLVNGERIAFPNQISMLFEANDLDVASPATVSRCGQCYFDLNDVNFEWQYWMWVEQKYKLPKKIPDVQPETQNAIIEILEVFAIKILRKVFGLRAQGQLPQVIQQADYAIIRLFIQLFEVFATDYFGLQVVVGEESGIVKQLEMITIFCVIWSVGGSLSSEGRKNFDLAIREMDGTIPTTDTVFDYRVDMQKRSWQHWGDVVPKNWRPDANQPLFSVIVPTVDTVRTEYMLKTVTLNSNLQYLRQRNARSLAGTNPYITNFGTMLFGVSGTGKTGIIKNILIPSLEQVDIGNSAFASFKSVQLKSHGCSDIVEYYVDGKFGQYAAVQLGLSAQTTADRLRIVIESRLQATSTSLAPKGRRLVAFLDDFNMPSLDQFGSQPCLEIIKQYIERGSWYRQKKDKYYLSNVFDVDILASMATPGGGRNNISGRILSKFNVLGIDNPSDAVLKTIFSTLLNIRFSTFEEAIKQLVDPCVTAGIDVYNTVSQFLLPTPIKPFYIFNLRDLSKFFLGIIRGNSKDITQPEMLIKLWTHECQRVYQDRMLPADKAWFYTQLDQKIGTFFNMPISKVYNNKIAPTFVDFITQEYLPVPFGKEGQEKIVGIYQEAPDPVILRQTVVNKLIEYNGSGAAVMDLVMFADALEHVCKICRILSQPQGHALLIGTGGSGRQSLARLAAYLENQSVFTIDVGKNYRNADFKEDMKKLFIAAGGAEFKPMCFLITDNQLADESFLEDINSVLSSGEIPGLFNAEDLQLISDNLGPICKAMGISETVDSCFQLLIRRAKENLHIVLCFSPSHEKFRTRLRMYPGLMSSCTIDLFGEWPLSALEEVGLYFINKFDDLQEYTKADYIIQKAKPQDPNLPKQEPESLSARLAHVFTTIHDGANQIYQQMVAATGRKLFATPANYLNFVRQYTTLFITQRNKIRNKMNKLQGGVGQLVAAKEDVTAMSIKLEEKRKAVQESVKNCDILLVELNAKSQVAADQQKMIQIQSDMLSKEKIVCEKQTAEAEYKLQMAMPALEAARTALDQLKDSAIQEVQNYKQYTSGVRLTLMAVMVLLNKPQTVEAIKAELSKPGFLQLLKGFDTNSISKAQMEQMKKYVNHEDFVPRTIEKASSACKCLCQWSISLYEYTNVYRQVKPLQEEAERLKRKLAQMEAELNVAMRKLDEANALIDNLKKSLTEKQNESNKLKKEEEDLNANLTRANKLVESLTGERIRWMNTIELLKVEIEKVPGDCIVATAFLCYSGGLAGAYRKQLMKIWMEAVKKYDIPASFTDAFNVASYIVDPAISYQWSVQGLPSDLFSTENGVLITQSSKPPFIIDPQKQATRWLKKMLDDDPKTKNNLKVLNVKDNNYLQQIELAVRHGAVVVLEDVTENLDPSLDPIILKQVVKRGGRNVIKLKDKEIEYNDNFKIFLCTRMNNPNLSPELFAKATIINFSVVREGLTDQLLACVVLKENKALEEKKSYFVTSTAQKKEIIIKLEDEILQQLANSEMSLLENEPLQKALERSKLTSDEVTKELENFAIMEKKIDTMRGGYKPIAERASLLFFVLQDMSQIDYMYQFSLDAYIKLFNNSIDNSPPSDDISHRIKNINDYHTYAVYKYCCRGLFTRHKVLLSLHMCVKILEAQNKINMEEYMFLLRGGQVFDKSQQPPNPNPEWISSTMWDNLCILDKMPAFRGIVPQFEQRIREWYANYFIVPEPELAPLIGDLDSTLDELQRMLVLRCLRPDRCIHGINNYVKNNLNTSLYNFCVPPAFDLKQALLDASPTTPLIFILSQGTDPTAMLINFAKECKFADRLSMVALGQGQQEIAAQAFRDGVEKGNWVLLANVHLSTDWLTVLEKMIEDLSKVTPHKDFRLWLSTTATPTFPIGLLQNSIKITTEAPSGIRANLTQVYNYVDEGMMNEFAPGEDEGDQKLNDQNPISMTKDERDNVFRKLLFSTGFFYALLVERRKFGTLGFNIRYPFSQADFETSTEILKLYLRRYEYIPWQAIRYVIAQIVFGGRLIDELDRRVLICYINDLFNDEVITEQNYSLSEQSDSYFVPQKGPLSEYRDYVKGLPPTDIADIFGQHNNADIFSRNVESAELLYQILKITTFTEPVDNKKDKDKKEEAEEGGGEKKEKGAALSAKDERIIKMAQDIQGALPAELANIPTTIDSADPNAPMISVLCQEAERFSRLRESIFKDLGDVQKGIRGLIGMSQHLDDVANSMYQNRVPSDWSNAYKSTKTLAPWSRDFKRRIEQLQQWANAGHPKCMWLGGLSVPTCYLTSLLQQASRKTMVAIDNLEWGFEITTWTDPIREVSESQVPKIGDGVLVYDMYLEGAGWSIDNKCLKDATPMELYVQMPIVKFIPQKQAKKSNKYKEAFYECPTYFYPIRTGSREQPSFMLNAWLSCGSSSNGYKPDFFIKRGTALLLNLGD